MNAKRLIENLRKAELEAAQTAKISQNICDDNSAQRWRAREAAYRESISLVIDQMIAREPEPQAPAPDHSALVRELVEELVAAHKIILNALPGLTNSQKIEWAMANERDDVTGEMGETRYHERQALIVRAKAALQ